MLWCWRRRGQEVSQPLGHVRVKLTSKSILTEKWPWDLLRRMVRTPRSSSPLDIHMAAWTLLKALLSMCWLIKNIQSTKYNICIVESTVLHHLLLNRCSTGCSHWLMQFSFCPCETKVWWINFVFAFFLRSWKKRLVWIVNRVYVDKPGVEADISSAHKLGTKLPVIHKHLWQKPL